MIIRKSFSIETAHKVLNCTTHRCSHSTHGHSALVEVFFTATGLDNGQMIVDFGLMKDTIKEFIDSFDHTYVFWNKMPEEEKVYHKKFSERWIELPVSPSAESSALLMLYVIDKIVKATQYNNGEKNPMVTSVRYHETTTGYAEAFWEDMVWINYGLGDIIFSSAIIDEWKDPNWFGKLHRAFGVYGEKEGGWVDIVDPNELVFINPIIKQQV